jgi:hypothetical protein
MNKKNNSGPLMCVAKDSSLLLMGEAKVSSSLSLLIPVMGKYEVVVANDLY